jgi:uncharacterized repeat protein (TIGR03803 family)
MRSLNPGHYALCSCVAAAILAACGGSQSPIENPGTLPQGAAAPLGPPIKSQAWQSANASNYRILFSFGRYAGSRGAYPGAGLIDVKGALYGTTAGGGPYYHGTVFSITMSGSQRVLYSFTGVNDGSNPTGGLIYVDGRLYGTASGGGSQLGYGTVFSLDTTGSHFRVLHTFAGGDDGAYPMAGLVVANGWLYGTTFQVGSGASGNGTVFAIRLSDGKERILYRFGGDPDGRGPMAALTYKDGTLFGTTAAGGAYNDGTVFSVDIAKSSERVLHSFTGSDGLEPESGLLIMGGGFYGTTAGGGKYNDGTVFSVNMATSKERVLHSFSGYDGEQPEAGLISTSSGRLYGTTYYGGAAGYGTVFRVDMNGRELVVHNFHNGDYHDGIFPNGTLLDVNERLYDTTYAGGRHNHHCLKSYVCDYGTVFKIKI